MHTHKHTDHTKFKLKTYNRSTSRRIKHPHTCLQTHTCSSMKTVNTTMTHSSMTTAKCKRQRSHLLPKVVQFEEGRSSLHLCLHQGRGVHLTNNQSTMCDTNYTVLPNKTATSPNYTVLPNNARTCTKLHCTSKHHHKFLQITAYSKTTPKRAPNYTVFPNTRPCTKLHCTSKHHHNLHQTTLYSETTPELAPNYTVLPNTRPCTKLHYNLHQTTLYSETTPELSTNYTVL